MSTKPEEFVAVMLPKSSAKYWADPAQVDFDPKHTGAITDACKRALRPEPPKLDSFGIRFTTQYPILWSWIEHVLKHGWEVE